MSKPEMKDARGAYRTNIFLEFNTSTHDEQPPLYTMHEEEREGLPSAKKIYMEAESEYEAAMQLVGSWQHWKRLLRCSPFMKGLPYSTWEGLEAWREEKEIRDKADALKQLKKSAEKGNVTAQKIIYEGEKKTKGRPKKADIEKQARILAGISEDVADDMKRLQLVK